MQYSHEHLKTMVYAQFGGQTECIMGNSKIENIPQQRGNEKTTAWRYIAFVFRFQLTSAYYLTQIVPVVHVKKYQNVCT